VCLDILYRKPLGTSSDQQMERGKPRCVTQFCKTLGGFFDLHDDMIAMKKPLVNYISRIIEINRRNSQGRGNPVPYATPLSHSVGDKGRVKGIAERVQEELRSH
jgi:hypothetical protein